MRLYALAVLITIMMIVGCTREPFPPTKGIPTGLVRKQLNMRYVGMTVEELFRRHGKPADIYTSLSTDPVSLQKVKTENNVYFDEEAMRIFNVKDGKVINVEYSMKNKTAGINR